MLAALVDALVERGMDVSLICAGRNGTRGRPYKTLERAQEERLGEAVPEILHGLMAERILADLQPDVIHDHTSAGLLAAPSRTRPTLATTHGPVTGEFGRLYASIDPAVGLVAISDAQRHLAPRLSWAGRVHNGLATADWPFRADKDDYVLFLGRFAQDKGLHVAIDASREAGLRLVVAGGARGLAEQRYVDEQVRPRLGPDVELFGEASYEQKQELLAGARCLVFPILWEEPFGMVQVEAMATGTPVVTLRRGSAPEVVTDGETGFVVDSIDHLPAALHQVCELDPLACRRLVEKHFDVSVMAAVTSSSTPGRRTAGGSTAPPRVPAVSVRLSHPTTRRSIVGTFVRLEVEDGIGTIRLDRPPMNALNEQVQDELHAAATEATENRSVRAVIIYGGEKVFAAGADIKEMAAVPRTPTWWIARSASRPLSRP